MDRNVKAISILRAAGLIRTAAQETETREYFTDKHGKCDIYWRVSRKSFSVERVSNMNQTFLNSLRPNKASFHSMRNT